MKIVLKLSVDKVVISTASMREHSSADIMMPMFLELHR